MNEILLFRIKCVELMKFIEVQVHPTLSSLHKDMPNFFYHCFQLPFTEINPNSSKSEIIYENGTDILGSKMWW